jgi:hypothetical protein
MGVIGRVSAAMAARQSNVSQVKGQPRSNEVTFGDILVPSHLNQGRHGFKTVENKLFPRAKDGGAREVTSLEGDTVSLSSHNTTSMMGRQAHSYVMLEGPIGHRDRLTHADENRVAQFLTKHNTVFLRFPHSLGHYIGDIGDGFRFTEDKQVYQAHRGSTIFNGKPKGRRPDRGLFDFERLQAATGAAANN